MPTSEESKTFSVALFKTSYSTDLAYRSDPDHHPTDWIQTSESVSVTFPSLPKAYIILVEVARIEVEIEETATRLHKELTRLKERKASLLAITQDSSYE